MLLRISCLRASFKAARNASVHPIKMQIKIGNSQSPDVGSVHTSSDQNSNEVLRTALKLARLTSQGKPCCLLWYVPSTLILI
jgi:hypothetical protein